MKLALSKFKKVIIMLTIIVSAMSMLTIPVSADGISVLVNGVQMISDSSPVNESGNILVPASSIFKMFDTDVSWDSNTGTMVVVAPGIRIVIKSGELKALVNGETIVLNTLTRTINKRLFIPINFFSDAFGAEVKWDKDLQLLTITGDLNMIQPSSTRDYAKAKMQAAIDGLSTTVSLELDAKANVVFEDLFKLEDYDEIKSWTYEGTKTNDKILITWKLELSDEHAVVSAYRSPALENKLTDKQKEILHKCKKILASIIKPGMTDYQKQLAIHDYIVLNCEYDVETLKKGQTASGHEDAFFAYGALINGVALCGGYTEAANILLRISGIESIRLDSEDHAWNLVKLEGGYYHMDVSWDDPTPDVKGRIRHDYFNLTDKQILQYSSHKWLNKEYFPTADSVKYNYFVYNGLVANNLNELKQVLTKAINSGEREITVMVSNHRTGGYVWDKDLEFIFDLLSNVSRVAKFSYSPPNSERDTLTIIIGL